MTSLIDTCRANISDRGSIFEHTNSLIVTLANVDTFLQHVKAASQPNSLGWEDTAILKRAAVANDAIPRSTNEPWAQAPSECRGHLEEAVSSPSSLIFSIKFQCRAPQGSKTPGKDRTLGFMFTEGKLDKWAERAVVTLACYMLTNVLASCALKAAPVYL